MDLCPVQYALIWPGPGLDTPDHAASLTGITPNWLAWQAESSATETQLHLVSGRGPEGLLQHCWCNQ